MVQNKNMKRNADGYFSPFDLHIANFITACAGSDQPGLHLAAKLVSRQLRDGHVCLNLRDYSGRLLAGEDDSEEYVKCPDLSLWLQSLTNATDVVGLPGEFKPLILDCAQRLYFHRYWQYENDIVQFVRSCLPVREDVKTDRKILRVILQRHFPEMTSEENIWPCVAAAAAGIRRFLVITGSPGTGKTTTVTKILAFLLEIQSKTLRIALCAPTGKAAARLEESVEKTKERLQCADAVKKLIPAEATTVHRLLGSIRQSPYFYFTEKNTLPYDIIVVDEASMVDLPLMAKLMMALAPSTQLILLGDKDQLASVEAGAVLGNICYPDPLNIFSREFETHLSGICDSPIKGLDVKPGIQDCIIELTQNFRFSEKSGIGVLSRAIKSGDAPHVLRLIDAKQYSDVHFSEIDKPEGLPMLVRDNIIGQYKRYLQAVTSGSVCTDDIFNLFETFRVLCALRVGSWGAQRLNTVIEKILADSGLVELSDPYYPGRPLMITQNDYRLRLFNGDIGIVLKDQENPDKHLVSFRDPRQGFRKIAPDRLPNHETAWAMTVHKSQGSEFDRVALILSNSDAPVLTRELFYTGITRARFHADIWASRDVLTRTIQKQILRQSGLTDSLQSSEGLVKK